MPKDNEHRVGDKMDTPTHVEKEGEKAEIAHSEMVDDSLHQAIVDEKALMRKIDWRMVPWLSFLYLLSFLDRSNVGNARVKFLGVFYSLIISL